MVRRRFALWVALVAFGHGGAGAMTASSVRNVECTVQRGELLPPGSGGEKALCDEVKLATAALSAEATKVSVMVLSAHAMAANVTVGEKRLPEIRMDRSDRELSRSAFRRFAQSIATAASTASWR